jgi:hypothetical protein
MLEVMLRTLAVLFLSVVLIAFGWYFSFGTDTLKHDWIYFGGGLLTLLAGIGTLFGALGSLVMGVREWGSDGITSDAGIVDPPPVEAKTSSPVADEG